MYPDLRLFVAQKFRELFHRFGMLSLQEKEGVLMHKSSVFVSLRSSPSPCFLLVVILSVMWRGTALYPPCVPSTPGGDSSRIY